MCWRRAYTAARPNLAIEAERETIQAQASGCSKIVENWLSVMPAATASSRKEVGGLGRAKSAPATAWCTDVGRNRVRESGSAAAASAARRRRGAVAATTGGSAAGADPTSVSTITYGSNSS